MNTIPNSIAEQLSEQERKVLLNLIKTTSARNIEIRFEGDQIVYTFNEMELERHPLDRLKQMAEGTLKLGSKPDQESNA